MAGTPFQFVVDDDSPEVAYYPFVDPFPVSANVSAGWQLLYTVSGAASSPGQVGVGTSYHYTTLDGASLLIDWNGTGIELLGSFSDALYAISLDGVPSTFSADPSNSVLASFANLQNTNHSILLTTTITNVTSANAFLIFDMAYVTYAPPVGLTNTTAVSQAVSDSDIAFMGQWTYQTIGNYSMHISNSAGDTAETTFSGSAITIYGLTSSYSGDFSVTLDNTTTTLSALSSYNDSDTLLFYATNLEDTLHNITVTNLDNHTLALRAGGMNITSFGNTTTTTTPTNLSSTSTMPAGTIAAIVLGIVLFLLILGILYYVCRVRKRARHVGQPIFFLHPGKPSVDRPDVERTTCASPRSGGELESTSLSTSKGYGFGLGLHRGLTFASRKAKTGSSSAGTSPNWRWTVVHTEIHPMTPQYDRDEKRLSIFTLTEDTAIAPESEELAPGWSYPVARAPPLKYTCWEEIALPEPHADRPPDEDADDADVKTLTSRQGETIAATLALSPRTSEARAAPDSSLVPKLVIDAPDSARQSGEDVQPDFLPVRSISPFRVDVSAILGTRKGNRDSRRTSGSGSSTWSKVRTRLYLRAHRDDGRQSCSTDKQDTSSISGPESVPVLMHKPSFPGPPDECVPGSGTYSFLDLTSSHVSLRPQSKATVSSTPAELGHNARDTRAGIVRMDGLHDDVSAPKPDAPSTASGGSHPSDSSDAHTVPSAPTTHTQISSFPFTIPSSPHIHPPDYVPERHITPSPPPPTESDQYLQVPQIVSPELPLTPANSLTESVPFSVSEIHFRHSFSDHAGFDSQRASVASALPPHPPLPHRDGSQASTPTYSPPPPYIVQRVLGLPISPLGSPVLLTSASRASPISPGSATTVTSARPGTAPIQTPVRVGSLLGPRPRPSTAGSGSIRGSAAPQLPMHGGRNNMRPR